MYPENCCGGACGSGGPGLKIGDHIPDVAVDIYHQENFRTAHLSDWKGKWIVFFFYPADFTFICPTELADMAEHYQEFQKLNTEILGVSTDTKFTHKAWHDHSPAIKKIQFPLVADPTHALSQTFGIYIEDGEDRGLAQRGTFLVDPDGVLQAFEVHANNIGRSAGEVFRKLQAAIFVREHGGEVCPANWKPGQKTLRPGIDLVGKI